MDDKKLTWLDYFMLFPVGLVFTIFIISFLIGMIKIFLTATWGQVFFFVFLIWFGTGVMYIIFGND